jgi:nitrate reductase cytochrome c-type subunit
MKRVVDDHTRMVIVALKKNGLAQVKCVGCGAWLEAYSRDDEWYADKENNPHGLTPTRFSCLACKVQGTHLAPVAEPEDLPS